MDPNQLFQHAKKWYPIFGNIGTILINLFAFLIGINWDPGSAWIISGFALLGTILFSATSIFILIKITKSSYVGEYTILESIDEYDILGSNKAVFRKIIKLRVNKPTPIILINPPTADGIVQDYQAFQYKNRGTKYEIHLQRISGRKLLILSLGQTHKKGDIVEGICIECQLINSFQSDQEGVSVSTDPGQIKCQITINLPPSSLLSSQQAEWYVLLGSNQTPLSNGNVEAKKKHDGSFYFTKDFSAELGDGIGRQCLINWTWEPNQDTTKNGIPEYY